MYRTKTLLVIEDDYDTAEMIRIHFKMKGFNVHIAHDGHEGIEKCDEIRPDIIFVDLEMKGMNGDEAAPHLRRIVPSAQIILLTTNAAEERTTASLMLFDAFVEKPLSILDLCASLKKIFQPADSYAERHVRPSCRLVSALAV